MGPTRTKSQPGSSNACPSAAILAAFVARSLPESERRRVEAHCNACETCGATLSHAVLAFAESAPSVSPPITIREQGPLPRGTALGRYLVLEELGRGAMGIVYAAYDPQLDRRVALKVLHTRLRWESDRASQWRSRLVREARALAAIVHPNVITIHDVGTWGDDVFIAMELVEGTTARQWLQERERSPQEILKVFLAAGRGLAAAHRRGLVHRDFKPDNVLVARDGTVRVSDFGLARFVAPPSDRDTIDVDVDAYADATAQGDLTTKTGGMIGTPAYMSPEQLQGRTADARSDQYSFCVALFEALYGQRPFVEATTEALLQAQREAPPRGPTKTRIPARVHRALARGLAFDPARRFESIDALLLALTPSTSRRRGASAMFAIGVAGVAVGAQFLPQEQDACATASAAELWNDDVAARLEAASIGAASIRGNAVTAAETQTRVKHRLRDLAATYERVEREACHIDNQAASLCLEAWRTDYEAVTARLSDPESDNMAVAANGLVQDLEDPSRCADPRWMPPLPRESIARARVSRAWLALAGARRDLTAGRFDAVRATLEAERAEVDALGHRPLQAEAQVLACELAAFEDRAQEATTLCSHAARTALAAGHRRAFEEATVSLAATFVALEQYDRGLDYLALAEATRAELGSPMSPELENQRAAILGAQGRYDEAIAVVKRALEALPADDHSGEFMLRVNLSPWLYYAGAAEEAEATARWSVQRATELYGEKHMLTTQCRTNLAVLLQSRGDPAAVELLEQAIAEHTANYGADHPLLLLPYHNYALALLRSGRSEQALAASDRAMAIAEATAPEAGLQNGEFRIARGQILADVGRESEALASFDEALVDLQSAVAEGRPEVISAAIQTALFYRSRRRDDDAASWLRLAKPVAEQHGIETPIALIGSLLEDRRRAGVVLAELREDEALDENMITEFIGILEQFERSAPKQR